MNDETMYEWEELERQLDEEKMYRRNDGLYVNGRNGNLPSIMEEAREKSYEENAFLDKLSSHPSMFDPLADRRSSTAGVTFDEMNLPPDATPRKYRKIITDYKVTNNGIDLSPEAYRDACENANPDGSLNLSKDVPQILSPSVLETLSARPMAPYAKPDKEITVEDLAEVARKSREYYDQHPEAQEELHKRLMEEEPSYGQESDLFKDALVDPQKEWEFWNQEIIQKQKNDSSALEKLLDEKMKLLEEMNKTTGDKNSEKESSSKRPNQTLGNDDDRNIFFVSAEEGEEIQKQMERDRLEHARNIARYYQDLDKEFEKQFQDSDSTKSVSSLGPDPKRVEDAELEENVVDNEVPAVVGETVEQDGEQDEWVLVEDPTSSDDAFYWNSATGEMRWDPPE